MAHGQLQIGWSRVDITPPGKVLVAGQFHRRFSDEFISPLTATALAMEVTGDDGNEQVVFLSCDLCKVGFKADLLRALDGRCPGLDLHKITANATHTHTGPATSRGRYEEPDNDPDFMNADDYRAWLVTRLADVVEAAWADRAPGGISRGFGYAVTGRCRRATYADGSALMYGPTDRDDFLGFESCDDQAVNMLFTHDADGGLTGMIVNLACTAQCDEQRWAISADYWHNVREIIAQRYGPDVHLVPQRAPSGDMSPHLMSDQTE
jgi:hypothetical protein